MNKLFYTFDPHKFKGMIYNLTKITEMLGDPNHYSYTRIKNMFRGMRGNSKKKDIQEVRKILHNSFKTYDKILASLEKEIDAQSAKSK